MTAEAGSLIDVLGIDIDRDYGVPFEVWDRLCGMMLGMGEQERR